MAPGFKLGGGVAEVGPTSLAISPDAKTVYLAGGAVLKARVEFSHVENARLLGEMRYSLAGTISLEPTVRPPPVPSLPSAATLTRRTELSQPAAERASRSASDISSGSSGRPSQDR